MTIFCDMVVRSQAPISVGEFRVNCKREKKRKKKDKNSILAGGFAHATTKCSPGPCRPNPLPMRRPRQSKKKDPLQSKGTGKK
jgi:hypothetical protein